ncbi:MAG: hypothetical protein BA863_16070 [Desulfovibrio sp. S3730MH75]|nr:MAG: hypothetical protein BA863_16070 [Desulfovibrio sp. S3730MH75]
MMNSISNFPSEEGKTTFKVFTPPVSSQGSRSKKDTLTEKLRNTTKSIPILLTGDVSIEILWFVNEVERYESDKTADVDNILKPILDALCGPEGILINDCQVQHVVSSWVDRYDEMEHIEISISYEPDAWFEKESIVFVQLENALCMPLAKNLEPECLKISLDIFEMQLQSRNRIFERGGTYYQARSVMSIQRLFHRTRVGGFEVKKIEELRQNLNNA